MVSEAVHKSMQGNKRADTRPELLLRTLLRSSGLTGYRLQWKIPGRPDIAWLGKKVALFVNGCFWHRCPRCNPAMPKTNAGYWSAKFAANQERDRRVRAELEDAGWIVHTVWECELKRKTVGATVAELFPRLAAELGKELPDKLSEGWAPRPPERTAEPAPHGIARPCRASSTTRA